MSRLKDVEYSDFRRALQERADRPLHAEFELTHRCNLSCIHCYLGARRGNNSELGLSQVKVILDKLQEAGFIWLVFTGGEPLLRKDFSEIYLYAKKLGFIIIILTNATLIDERIAELFAAHKPFYLDISIHGAEKGTYEGITGVPGSFARFMHGIELLRKNDIAFKLKTKAMKENAASLENISSFAVRLEVPHKTSGLVHPCIDGDLGPVKHRLDSSRTARNIAPQCAAGRFSVSIDPIGRLMVCEGCREPSYDIVSGSIEDGMRFLKRNEAKRECVIR